MNSITESKKDNSADPDFKQNLIYLTSTQEICWNVRNFKSLSEAEGYSLDSPPYVFQNATWCLRLYLKGTCLCEPYIGLTIVRLNSLVPHHRLHCSFIWTDDNIAKYSLVANFDDGNKENGSWGFVLRSYAESKLFKTDIFRLLCRVSCYGSSFVDAFSQTEEGTKDVDNLGQSFKDLLLNGQTHDVVLKVKGKEFRAHQDVLRVRSPVLESMLSHDMLEKNSGVIDIPDCDPDAFAQFLLFVYSGEVETLDAGNMLALYYVADKYDARYLKEKCRECIKKSLTPTNVSDAIKVALNHSDADLLENAKGYFVEQINEILPTVEWQSFVKDSPIQANELFLKAAKNMTDLIKTLRKT